MKFVATSNFRNCAPEWITVEGELHPGHVHKGARLSIGGNLPLEQMTSEDRELVAALNRAKRGWWRKIKSKRSGKLTRR